MIVLLQLSGCFSSITSSSWRPSSERQMAMSGFQSGFTIWPPLLGPPAFQRATVVLEMDAVNFIPGGCPALEGLSTTLSRAESGLDRGRGGFARTEKLSEMALTMAASGVQSSVWEPTAVGGTVKWQISAGRASGKGLATPGQVRNESVQHATEDIPAGAAGSCNANCSQAKMQRRVSFQACRR